jgi:hypothetical protein
MNKDRIRLLDTHLDLLQQKGKTLEGLRDELPPEHEQLWPLLILTGSLEELNPTGPTPEYIRTARIRIWNQVEAQSKHRSRRVSSPRSFPVAWRRALAGGLLACALIFSGLGVASASALPGDALYELKRGFETIQLSLAFSQETQAQLMTRFAAERIEEIEALSQVDRQDDLVWAVDEYNQTLDDLINISTDQGVDWGENWSDLQDSLHNHTEVLQAVMERVPESAQEAIQHAIERSNHGQDVLEILQQGGNPSDLAPGQQDRPNIDHDNQPNNPSNNGNAYGRYKDKGDRPGNRGNRGRGNSNGGGSGNPHDDPDGDEEDGQEED